MLGAITGISRGSGGRLALSNPDTMTSITTKEVVPGHLRPRNVTSNNTRPRAQYTRGATPRNCCTHAATEQFDEIVTRGLTLALR